MVKYKFDLYAAIGLSQNASNDEIKKAYRELAAALHPDKRASQSALESKLVDEAMYGINEAFSVLANPDLRRDYDNLLTWGIRPCKPSFYDLVRKIKEKNLAQGTKVRVFGYGIRGSELVDSKEVIDLDFQDYADRKDYPEDSLAAYIMKQINEE